MQIRLLTAADCKNYSAQSLALWEYVTRWLTPATTPRAALQFLVQAFEETALTTVLPCDIVEKIELMELINLQMQAILQPMLPLENSEPNEEKATARTLSDWEVWVTKIMYPHLQKDFSILERVIADIKANTISQNKIDEWFAEFACIDHLRFSSSQLQNKKEQLPLFAYPMAVFGATAILIIDMEWLKVTNSHVNQAACNAWEPIRHALFGKRDSFDELACIDFLENYFKNLAGDPLRDIFPKEYAASSKSNVRPLIAAKLHLLRIILQQIKLFFAFIDDNRQKQILECEKLLTELILRLAVKHGMKKDHPDVIQLMDDIVVALRSFAKGFQLRPVTNFVAQEAKESAPAAAQVSGSASAATPREAKKDSVTRAFFRPTLEVADGKPIKVTPSLSPRPPS